MRFTSFASLLLVAPSLMAFALPTNSDQIQMSIEALLGDEDDICPDLKVRCIKDGDITRVVGDIGEQSFCKSGVNCVQCHSKKNTLQCNAKFLKDCAGGCEAYGSPI